MKSKIQTFLKRVIIILLCTITVGSSIVSIIPTAQAASESMLRSSAAMSSPILNNNFTVDNWNKWEMICWGVFLSNFCKPLIDDYESAFKTGKGGSNGSGYKALTFGSGSDVTNNKVIESLCNYAIKQQQASANSAVYVTYTHYKDGKIEDSSKADANAGTDNVREAYFNDLFFKQGLKEKTTSSTKVSAITGTIKYSGQYTSMLKIKEAYVPTFWIKNRSSQKYVKILDYNNSWDLQMVIAMANAVRTSDKYKLAFSTAFDLYYKDKFDGSKPSGTKLGFDVFGNILVNGKMVVPASANQNLTTDKKINLLNSYVFNSYASTYSRDTLRNGLSQDKGKILGVEFFKNSGLPAFTKSEVGNVGLLYYDLDTIIYQDYDESSLNFSEAMLKLFNQSIGNDTNKYTLKFEVGNTDSNYYGKKDALEMTALLSSLISNIDTDNTISNLQAETLSYIYDINGNQINLFSSKPVVVAPQLTGADEKEGNAVRCFYDFLYQVYTGDTSDTTSGSITKTDLENMLSECKDFGDFKKVVKDTLWKKFQTAKPKYAKVSYPSQLWDWGDNNSISYEANRLCLVYPVSDVLKCVSSYLGAVDGTEFKTYSTMIYMTYLDWYGVTRQTTLTSGTNKVSDFSEEIYDESHDVLNVDPASLFDSKIAQDIYDTVLQLSYVMMSLEEGREYRKQMICNAISDFLYEQYNRIAFGGASDDYKGSSSKSNSGFLAIEPYSENMFTSWFIERYVDIAIILIGICSLILIVSGLLRSKKLSWFVFGLFAIVNVVLLVPSSGEIVPYVTTRFVQKMFSSKMTAWSMEEGISNAKMENDAMTKSGNMKGLTDDEALEVTKLVKQLNVVYLDRSLMLKQDISQKLTQKLGSMYSDIQSIASARWVLPMIMQQFSDQQNVDEGSLYVKLSNVWDDASNLYWYYKPEDALNVTKPTTTSSQFNSEGGAGQGEVSTALDSEKKIDSTYFIDYVKPSWRDDKKTNINYANYSYTIRDNADIVHLYSWYLPDTTRAITTSRKNILGNNAENFVDADSWQAYIDSASTSGTMSNWETTRALEAHDNYIQSGFESISSDYDRTNASTLKAGYSFYKTTESPLYYFFNVVKDSFPNEVGVGTGENSVGSVIGRLMGDIKLNEDGDKVRSSFMYASETIDREQENAGGTGIATDAKYTGYVRDCLDLQEFFNNVIPYMYQMTLTTGGFDGESGILRESIDGEYQALKISEGSLFEGNLQSWAYRCNWAVKLMENPDLISEANIKSAPGGNRITIKNPMLPESYEAAGRPMIFSEAQMHAYGLDQSCLSVVELKCIKVNNEVAKQWTYLLNYAGAEGITKEVLFRQMATDAAQVFCREFSSNGIVNNLYNIYPQSIDLRYLSFNSIMKMLMLNASKNTSYIYGDTMKVLIEDTDLATGGLLWFDTLLCASIIPFIRTILMAWVYFLGFWSVFRSLFSSSKFKVKIVCGQLVSNILLIIYTMLYYSVFSLLMTLTSADEVLSVNKINMSAGNPAWVLIIILGVSGLYVAAMIIQIMFCGKNWRDMGFEIYSQVAGAVAGKISNAMHSAVGNAQGNISNFFNSEESVSNSSSLNSVNGTGIMNKSTQSISGKQSSSDVITVDNDMTEMEDILQDVYSASYDDSDLIDTSGIIDASDINAEIEAGKQI